MFENGTGLAGHCPIRLQRWSIITAIDGYFSPIFRLKLRVREIINKSERARFGARNPLGFISSSHCSTSRNRSNTLRSAEIERGGLRLLELQWLLGRPDGAPQVSALDCQGDRRRGTSSGATRQMWKSKKGPLESTTQRSELASMGTALSSFHEVMLRWGIWMLVAKDRRQ